MVALQSGHIYNMTLGGCMQLWRLQTLLHGLPRALRFMTKGRSILPITAPYAGVPLFCTPLELRW